MLGDIHVYHHLDPALERKLDRVLNALFFNQEIIMADLTQLQTDVAANTSVTESALALINGFAAQLKAAGTDPAALAALQQQLESNNTALAAAVAANTQTPPPAAPAPDQAPPTT